MNVATSPDASEQVQWACALMQSRKTVLPKRLVSPGPNDAQLETILAAAASAPDHEQLLPWRLILVPAGARQRLAQVFADALLERDASASSAEIDQAREKAYRAPVLMLLVVDGDCGASEVDLCERIASAGCAVQNVLLMATAHGYGSALTSGKALKSTLLRDLFTLRSGELALCFVSIGTAVSAPKPRLRPSTSDYVSTLV
jgi:nitroreductase